MAKIGFALAILGLLLLGGACWLYVQGSLDRPGLAVSDPHRVLVDIEPQHDYEVAFCIHNPSGRSARLVGLGIT